MPNLDDQQRMTNEWVRADAAQAPYMPVEPKTLAEAGAVLSLMVEQLDENPQEVLETAHNDLEIIEDVVEEAQYDSRNAEASVYQTLVAALDQIHVADLGIAEDDILQIREGMYAAASHVAVALKSGYTDPPTDDADPSQPGWTVGEYVSIAGAAGGLIAAIGTVMTASAGVIKARRKSLFQESPSEDEDLATESVPDTQKSVNSQGVETGAASKKPPERLIQDQSRK